MSSDVFTFSLPFLSVLNHTGYQVSNVISWFILTVTVFPFGYYSYRRRVQFAPIFDSLYICINMSKVENPCPDF